MEAYKKVLSQIEAKKKYNNKLIIMHVEKFDIFNCEGKIYIFDLNENDDFFTHYKTMLKQYPENVFMFYGENVGVLNEGWVDVSAFKKNNDQ